jgi:large subunit ribosomal protein L6
MSRIGKKPIVVPKGVTASLEEDMVEIKGPKGLLRQQIVPNVDVEVSSGVIHVKRVAGVRRFGAYQGLMRSLLANMVHGVTEGFEKKLSLVGVGYRVALEGKSLLFNLGYSHQIEFPLPEGIQAEVFDKGANFSIKGIDKHLVGQTCATIRGFRSPEPYKGKGIRYADEHVRQKAGKAGAK